MRILVTGVKGQLGYDCVRELSRRGFTDVRGIDIDDLDITDEKAVHRYVGEYRPDVVIHCAAWTAVDKAEECAEAVYRVNALGPKYLAEASADIGAAIVYISTDYVFPGTGERPYEVDDPKGPLGVYGSTKLEGERFVAKANPKHFIIRISWVFGKNGNNFVKTMLRLGKQMESLSVVNDQIGSPTYTVDLSRLIVDMIQTDRYGVYHATNEGFCSWAAFAQNIFEYAGYKTVVTPISTDEYKKAHPNQASRPLNSRLSKKKLTECGFDLLPSWQDALKRYLKELDE